jgi:hypothetical protein
MMPGIGRLGPQLAQVAGESRPELEHPSPDRLRGGVDTTLSQEFLDVALAQGEPGIEPDGVPDHLGVQPPAKPCSARSLCQMRVLPFSKKVANPPVTGF